MSSITTYDCITETAIKNFKPTYLYIKRHSLTGLLYFGKTTKTGKAFDVYSGSGTYWKRHIRKHGKNVETVWFCLFTDIHNLVDFSLTFTRLIGIVESSDWANQMEETGICQTLGTIRSKETGKKISKSKMGHEVSSETRENQRQAQLGKKQSEETKKKRSIANTGQKRTIEQIENFRQIQLDRNYKPSDETIERIKEARSKQIMPPWTPERRLKTKLTKERKRLEKLLS